MQFDSFTFALFFLAVLVLFQLAPNWKLQKIVLLVASYLFYAAWSAPLVVLIWISTVTDFTVARLLQNSSSQIRRRLLLITSLAVNIGLLSYFKYAQFLMDGFTSLVGQLGVVYCTQYRG
jgi:alginate O-acetyltransferase complex protein AlgI